ncbi:MAG: undecaprenyl-diphosphate phosphatase [Planctomycetota bacterium]|jgi:undecaprenyl-diphosphatase
MEWWQAAILGLVEGITEYLPISSTGHLILAAALTGLDRDPLQKPAIDAFTIVIQGGAILAVLGLYRARVGQMLLGVAGRNPAGRKLVINLALAFVPAATLGLLLGEQIERWLFRPVPVIAALALGGVVMIFLTPWQRRHFHGVEAEVGPPETRPHTPLYVDIEHLSWRRALAIGLFQCLALWPGTSRSMTTIIGGMLAGMRPRHAAEFSFLLGLPTLGGACIYRAARSYLSDDAGMLEVVGVESIIIGVLVATVSAAVAIKWLVSYLSRHGVAIFGWYRLVLCLTLAALMAAGIVEIGAE